MKKRFFVAVAGLYCSGSTEVVHALQAIGVNMGDHLVNGEAVGLAKICDSVAKFPLTTVSKPGKAISQLRPWVSSRFARCDGHVGGKHPTLCALGRALHRAAGNRLRVINCDRPLADSIDAMQAEGGWGTADECEAVQRWLWDSKCELINNLNRSSVLDIKADDLASNRESVIREIRCFLGMRKVAK